LAEQPRYEFRVWGDDLLSIRQRLENSGRLAEIDRSTEIYLLSEATDECNAKIRSDLLDLKTLLDRHEGLERWKPVLKVPFPLDREVVANQIFPRLGFNPPSLPRSQYRVEEFLIEVCNATNEITVVQVSKERLRYASDRCEMEFAIVIIDHTTRQTVAVEATETEPIFQMAEKLGIRGLVNTSYIREIKRVLGSSQT
jgi:hypothetical protein